MLFAIFVFNWLVSNMTGKAIYSPEEDDRMIEAAFRDLMDCYLRSNHRKKV